MWALLTPSLGTPDLDPRAETLNPAHSTLKQQPGEAMTSIFDAIMKFQFDKKGTPGVVKVLFISERLLGN